MSGRLFENLEVFLWEVRVCCLRAVLLSSTPSVRWEFSVTSLSSSSAVGVVVSHTCVHLGSLVIICAVLGSFPHPSGYDYYHLSLSSVKFILGFDMIVMYPPRRHCTELTPLPRPPPAVPLKSAPSPTPSPSKLLICFPSLHFAFSRMSHK